MKLNAELLFIAYMQYYIASPHICRSDQIQYLRVNPETVHGYWYFHMYRE